MHNSKPLFSILIANYNNDKYIEACINSVLLQSYDNWEIVIVDDQSTDNSWHELLKFNENSKIRVYRNKSNKGCGYTKRRCADLVKGDIAGFLDPDDTLELDAIEIMVKKHLLKPTASLIYSTHYLCDEQLNVVKINHRIGAISKSETYLSSYGKGKTISHFASFKTELYQTTIGINPKLIRAVDQDLYYKLEEVGTIVYVDKPLYNYRYYRTTGNEGISTSINAIKALYWHLLVIDDAIKRRKKHPNIKSLSKKDRVFYWEDYLFTQANKAAKNNRRFSYYKYIIRSLFLYPSTRTILKMKLILKPTK